MSYFDTIENKEINIDELKNQLINKVVPKYPENGNSFLDNTMTKERGDHLANLFNGNLEPAKQQLKEVNCNKINNVNETNDDNISEMNNVDEKIKDLEALIDDISLTPEEILSKLTLEDRRELIENIGMADTKETKKFTCKEFKNDELYLLTLTNEDREFSKKFYITAMIGFLNATNKQRENATDEEKATVDRFLNDIFGFNPEKHFKVAKQHINKTDSYRTNIKIPKIPVEMVKQMPSIEQVDAFGRYVTNNYELLRTLTSWLYATYPFIEDTVQIFGHFNSKEALDKFRKKHANEFSTNPITIRQGEPTLFAPFEANRNNVVIYSSENPLANAIFEEQRKAKKMAESMVKNRVNNAAKKSGFSKMSKEERDKFMDYTKYVNDFPGIDQPTPEEIEKFDKYKKELQDISETAALPEGALQLDIYEIDNNAPKGKQITRKIMYTKAEGSDDLILDKSE